MTPPSSVSWERQGVNKQPESKVVVFEECCPNFKNFYPNFKNFPLIP